MKCDFSADCPTKWQANMAKRQHWKANKKGSSGPSGGVTVLGRDKNAQGAIRWRVRGPDGRIETWTTSASSATAMEQIAKRYAGTLNRLAKR